MAAGIARYKPVNGPPRIASLVLTLDHRVVAVGRTVRTGYRTPKVWADWTSQELGDLTRVRHSRWQVTLDRKAERGPAVPAEEPRRITRTQ